MPLPRNVSPPPDGFASPVPAHSVPSGLRASAPIACVYELGQAGVQVLPPSVLFMIPPLETAAYTVDGDVAGSMARSTTRPPMLAGPTNCQGARYPTGMLIACCWAWVTWAALTGCPSSRFTGGASATSPLSAALGGAAEEVTTAAVPPAIMAVRATTMVRDFARLTRFIASGLLAEDSTTAALSRRRDPLRASPQKNPAPHTAHARH